MAWLLLHSNDDQEGLADVALFKGAHYPSVPILGIKAI